MPNGHTKNWLRLCAAIDGFRARYGTWPVRVRLLPLALDDLRHLFVPNDFVRITAKIALVAEEDSFVAEDDLGNRYDYWTEGFCKASPEIPAAEWFGVHPVGEEEFYRRSG